MTQFPAGTLSAETISQQISLLAYSPSDELPVNQLLDAAFGADRLNKSSYKLRDNCTKIDELSFVAVSADDGEILATISYWQFNIAGEKALLLGPLAVNPLLQGQGLGKYIMDETLKLAAKIANKHGWQFTLLIGDLDYYQKSGFQRVPLNTIDYPQPTDQNRILFHEFVPNSLQKLINNHPLPLKLNQ